MSKMMHYGKAPCGCMLGMVVEQFADTPQRSYDAHLTMLADLEEEAKKVGGSMCHGPLDDVIRMPVKCDKHKATRG